MEIKVEDIIRAIKGELEAPETGIVATGVSFANPGVGAAIAIAKETASAVDQWRMNWLIKGLSTRLNQEKQINLLYQYVRNNKENAFWVASSFRKVSLMESPIAITALGVLLSKKISSDQPFSQNDAIASKALENATDWDLKRFIEIMKLYVDDKKNISIPTELMAEKYESTCNWGLYNRLFIAKYGEYDEETEGLTLDSTYKAASPAYCLLAQLNEIKQVFDY